MLSCFLKYWICRSRGGLEYSLSFGVLPGVIVMILLFGISMHRAQMNHLTFMFGQMLVKTQYLSSSLLDLIYSYHIKIPPLATYLHTHTMSCIDFAPFSSAILTIQCNQVYTLHFHDAKSPSYLALVYSCRASLWFALLKYLCGLNSSCQAVSVVVKFQIFVQSSIGIYCISYPAQAESVTALQICSASCSDAKKEFHNA